MPDSLLIHSENQPGNFAPHSGTWNIHVDHRFSANLRIRGGYTDTQSSGLILLSPAVVQGSNALMLTGDGHARYRAAELTARYAWKRGQWFFAYTRSRSEGDLNDFSDSSATIRFRSSAPTSTPIPPPICPIAFWPGER